MTDRTHIHLISDISELTHLVTRADDIDRFLSTTVELIARHLDAHVGSIYLVEPDGRQLVLRATIGLNPSAVDRVRMNVGEGLVGRTLQQMQATCEGNVKSNPHFKHFKEADEDPFESLLAVPIARGNRKIGVLVVQHQSPDYFGPMDVLALKAIASQLAGAIENVRLMLQLTDADGVPSDHTALKLVRGKTASAGYAHAPAMIYGAGHRRLSGIGPESEFNDTLPAFRKAVDLTIAQLKTLQEQAVERLPESVALIFEAHFMMLKDPRFVRAMEENIRQGRHPAAAVREVAGRYIDRFADSTDQTIREKADDIEDLALRLLFNLRRERRAEPGPVDGRIVIARELFPSDILKLAAENVRGVVLVSGGATSHVAILARSLQLPVMIADDPTLLHLPLDTPLLLDADIGNLYVHPSPAVVDEFERRQQTRVATRARMDEPPAPAMTACGTRVQLMANINLLSELALARGLNAEGVGLYRTEFPFLIRTSFPSEAEQYRVYRRLCEDMAGKPVVIRTLDVGGEKLLPYMENGSEANPELGLRSIRFSLTHPEVFRDQLRAILRAAADTDDIHIMFPMISSLDEFQEARGLLDGARAELEAEGRAHHPGPKVGMMVEMPSAVAIIDELAAAADFFSIGSNDFIQYMLAVDRSNEKVADYYAAHHPSVLRGLHRVVAAARKAGTPVSICGEMGHDPDLVPFLLGIGIRRFSVDPQHLAAVREIISAVDIGSAETYARALLAEARLSGIDNIIARWRDRGFGP